MDAVYDDKTRIGSSATDDVIDVITDDFISQEKYWRHFSHQLAMLI